jgi:hypothetical protein
VLDAARHALAATADAAALSASATSLRIEGAESGDAGARDALAEASPAGFSLAAGAGGVEAAGTLDRHLYRFARDQVSFRLYHAWDKEDLYNQTSNSTLYIYFAMPKVGRAFQLIGTSSNPWFYGNTKVRARPPRPCGRRRRSNHDSPSWSRRRDSARRRIVRCFVMASAVLAPALSGGVFRAVGETCATTPF